MIRLKNYKIKAQYTKENSPREGERESDQENEYQQNNEKKRKK